MKFNKIFQIGFNKTGTLSINNLFNHYSNPRLCSIHWNYGYLANTIYNNIHSGIHFPLFGYYGFDVFCDMECFVQDEDNTIKYISIYKDYFDLLDINYPNSLFILNIRNTDKWINSRLNHFSHFSTIDTNGRTYHVSDKIRYIDLFKSVYQTDDEKSIIDIWIKEYEEHVTNVKEYFIFRPKTLLVYDIENDSFDKIKDFFSTYDIDFLTNQLPHLHKTNV